MGIGQEAEKIIKCKEVILAKRPKGWVTEDDIKVRETEVETGLSEGEALLQLLWVSLDPYLRTRMNDEGQGLTLYMPPFQIDKPIESFSVLKVIASNDKDYKVGELVVDVFPIREYVKMVGGKGALAFASQKIDPSGVPLSYNLGALGMTSFTAWIGLVLIGQPKPGEQVFVSAASGAVGLAVGQLAKSKGCRVVGSAGSDEKVKLLKEEFGFDDAFNYKTDSEWDAALGRLMPKGIDIYFENVGGRMLDAVLNHINTNGRIAACGMISQYNKEASEREGVYNLMNIIGKSVKVEGFLVQNYYNWLPEFLGYMMPLLKQGKFKYKEHVTEGIENFASAFIGMLKGEKIGKALVHVCDP